jgi:hypothetical protein
VNGAGRLVADYIGKPERLISAAGVAVTLVAVALLCWVLAYWFWRVVTPAPDAPRVEPDRGDWAATIAAARLFATANGSPTVERGATTAQFTLLGALAQRDGKGYALLRPANQTTRMVSVGQEITAGVTLERVDTQQIVVRDHGREITMPLRATTQPLASASTAAGTKGAVPRCPLSAAELAHAYLLRSELLDGVAKDPHSWQSFLRAQDGGLQVAADAGVGKLLGLDPFDRLERSNGVQIASLDDLNRAFIRPLQQNQVVRVTGQRKDKAMEWVYVNAAACVAGR